jgi:leader peptidase (prepilin peptidase)/N-methyltransferase
MGGGIHTSVLLILFVGWLLGIGVNMAIDRLPLDAADARFGLPVCPSCGKALGTLRTVPIVGFAVAGGRCEACGVRLPWRRLAVEIAVPALCFATWLRFDFSWLALFTSLYCLLFVIFFFVDLEHRIIPDVIVLPAMVLAVVLAVFWSDATILPSVLFKTWTPLASALVGFGVGFVFMLIPAMLGGMGFGDVKLAGLIGLMVGFPLICEAIFITVVLGGIVAILLLIARRMGRRDYIPYGTFLAIGAVVTLLYGQPIFQWYIFR